MSTEFDFFIDESCHLENDHYPVMCIGYIKVPRDQYAVLTEKFKAVLEKHNFDKELKWQNFSGVRIELYKELVDFFFGVDICFRSILIKYKDRLKHEDFNQGSHDNFYYKMVYYLLRPNDNETHFYRVFIDVKDTRGREKLRKINEVFDNKWHGKSPFKHFQHLHSHDNLFFQLADFFIGAITYKTRVVQQNIPQGNKDKMTFIDYLEEKSGFHLNEGTEPWEYKFNIFDHQPKQRS